MRRNHDQLSGEITADIAIIEPDPELKEGTEVPGSSPVDPFESVVQNDERFREEIHGEIERMSVIPIALGKERSDLIREGAQSRVRRSFDYDHAGEEADAMEALVKELDALAPDEREKKLIELSPVLMQFRREDLDVDDEFRRSESTTSYLMREIASGRAALQDERHKPWYVRLFRSSERRRCSKKIERNQHDLDEHLRVIGTLNPYRSRMDSANGRLRGFIEEGQTRHASSIIDRFRSSANERADLIADDPDLIASLNDSMIFTSAREDLRRLVDDGVIAEADIDPIIDLMRQRTEVEGTANYSPIYARMNGQTYEERRASIDRLQESIRKFPQPVQELFSSKMFYDSEMYPPNEHWRVLFQLLAREQASHERELWLNATEKALTDTDCVASTWRKERQHETEVIRRVPGGIDADRGPLSIETFTPESITKVFGSWQMQEYWKVFKEHPAVRKMFGETTLTNIEEHIADTTTSELLNTPKHTPDSNALGERLLSFRSKSSIPLTIMNFWRESGFSGEYPFIGGLADSSDTPAYEYINSLTPDELEEIERSGSPAIIRVIETVRAHPHDFSQTHIRDPRWNALVEAMTAEYGGLARRDADRWLTEMREQDPVAFTTFAVEHGCDPEASDVWTDNPVVVEIQRHLTDAAIDFLKSHDHEKNFFAVSLIEGFEPEVLERVYPLIQERLRSTDDPLEMRAIVEFLIHSVRDGTASVAPRIFADALPLIKDNQQRSRAVLAMRDIIIGQELRMYSRFSHLLPQQEAPRTATSEDRAVSFRELERNLTLLSSDDQAVRRAAAELLSAVAERITDKEHQYAGWPPELWERLLEDVQTSVGTLREQQQDATTRGESDPVTDYYSIRTRYALDPEDLELSHDIAELYENMPEIKAYDVRAEQQMNELLKDSILEFTQEDIRHIVGHLNDEKIHREIVTFLALTDRLDDDMTATIRSRGIHVEAPLDVDTIQILLDRMSDGNGRFADGAEIPVTEGNWKRMLTLHAQLEHWEGSIPERFREPLKRQFSLDEHPENVRHCMEWLRSAWVDTLANNDLRTMPLWIESFGKTSQGIGLGHLRQIEALIDVTDAGYRASVQPSTAERTVHEIASTLGNCERITARWSDDDRTRYYDNAASMLRIAPSLFAEFGQVTEGMSSKEFGRFAEEVFPLLQAELVILKKGDDATQQYAPRDLVRVRQQISAFRPGAGLSEQHGGTASAYQANRDRLVESVREGFQARFGIVRIPEAMDATAIRTIQNMVRYAGNINDSDAHKEALIGWYLGLALNGKWDAFRRGEEVDPAEILDEDHQHEIRGFLAERTRLDVLTPERLNISPDDMPEFALLLEDETMRPHIGNVETVDRKLEHLLRQFDTFDDPDTFPDPEEQAAVALYRAHGEKVGKVLGLTFREAKTGVAVDMTPDDRAIQERIAGMFGVTTWTPEAVKSIQDRTNAARLVARTQRSVADRGVPEAIEELHHRLQPTPDVIATFRRLGEHFTSESGAMALASDLSYLESIVVKYSDRLTEGEKTGLETYLVGVREQLVRLEGVFEDLRQYLTQLRGAVDNGGHDVLARRVSEIEASMTGSAQERHLISRMTSDPNLIIENMRQCLGCLSAECNNDTNLSFGDRNKFYLMSQTESAVGSIADEIVYLEPTTHPDGRKDVSFVLDRVYGAKSSDVLLSHALTVLKKYQTLKERFPDATLSVTVTSSAMASVGLSPDILQKHLEEHLGGSAGFEFETDASVDVAASAASDHYIEFGGDGGARKAGPRSVNGLVIR